MLGAERAAVPSTAAAPAGLREARVEQLRAALVDVVQVPPGYRHPVTTDAAARVLRCTRTEVEALAQLGLQGADGVLDRDDVWNLGLYDPARRSAPSMEMLFFERTLRSGVPGWVARRTYAVVAEARCPAGARCAGGSWEVALRGAVAWAGSAVDDGVGRWWGDVTLDGEHVTAPSPRVADLWRDVVDRLRYHATPGGLVLDAGATRARGVGDCETLARLLHHDITAAGLPADLRVGYLMGGVRARRHFWVALGDGTPGLTLDPAMAVLAHRFFDDAYREFCCGSRFNRVLPVGAESDFFVRHACAGAEHRLDVTVGGRLR